jgi:hypothetical protein
MTRNEWPRRRAAPALLGSFTGTLYGCLEWVAREARRLGVIETRSLEEELILRLSERWYALAAKAFAVVQNGATYLQPPTEVESRLVKNSKVLRPRDLVPRRFSANFLFSSSDMAQDFDSTPSR